MPLALQDAEWVDDRLRQVADILPDLSGRLDNMKADIVIQLVSDIQVNIFQIAQLITGFSTEILHRHLWSAAGMLCFTTDVLR